ncbi:MAG: indole-3-glycerol-phosphate synthase, partial [Bacteroidetes bacterium]
MNILDKIIAHKRKEVARRKARIPIKLLEESLFFNTPVVSLSKYLQRPDKSGIIAEFKRKSPSKAAINLYASVEQVSIGYMQAGASALSILTDEHFFGGKNEDLTTARKFNFCPILRKDFIIDEYQIIEARSIGADAVLLIAACLEKEQLHDFAKLARSLGLEVLVELHHARELDKLSSAAQVVG